jgi:Flp pilus assembly protein TadG
MTAAFRPIRRRLAGDERGVTVVEFAIILPVLCMVLLGTLDLGYRSYVASVLQGALHEAARMATVGGVTQAQIDARVRSRLHAFSNNATIQVETGSYSDFSSVRQPEKITQDTAPAGYSPGDCYEDANANGRWDADRSASGVGGADDIVNYQVTISYPRIVPIWRVLGWGDTETITSNTVLRNQPYAARVNRMVPRCN